MSRFLFAYGTLRDADVLALALGRPAGALLLRAAFAPGCEVVGLPGRSYPAIRRRSGGRAEGVLIEGLGAADFVALDGFEGSEYLRGPIDLIVNGLPRAADVYWPAVEIGEGSPWRFEEWTDRHKAGFLSSEAGNIA